MVWERGGGGRGEREIEGGHVREGECEGESPEAMRGQVETVGVDWDVTRREWEDIGGIEGSNTGSRVGRLAHRGFLLQACGDEALELLREVGGRVGRRVLDDVVEQVPEDKAGGAGRGVRESA